MVLKNTLWMGSLAAALVLGSAPVTFVILNTLDVRSGKLPEGWQMKVNRGVPSVAAVNSEGGQVLRLKSRDASFGLERGVDVNLQQYPYLSWRWMVTQLPPRGDFRRASTDDQAAQVLVAFTDRRVLTYLWDTTAPQGLMQSASSIPFVHIFAVVCRSGAAELSQWVTEVRNIPEDYRKAYGKDPPRVKGIRLQINTQHTRTSAESYFGEVAFRSVL
ncbi:MAG: DUF3047 domain-containing protein [Bryobacteraceae bacterium]